MTKEDAIEHIKTSCYLVGYPSHDKEYETRKCINEALDMAIKALEQQPSDDCVSRAEVLNLVRFNAFHVKSQLKAIENMPPVTPTQRWTPVSEKLPKDLEPVNITWVNHNPVSYYANIKDKPFTSTGVYFNRQWYWWSATCIDTLAEYSDSYDDVIDNDIEIIAWQPLPKPYEEKRGGEYIIPYVDIYESSVKK